MTEFNKMAIDSKDSHCLTDNRIAIGKFDSTSAPSNDADLLALLEASSEEMRREKSKFRLKNFGVESIFLPSLDASIEYIFGMSFKQILEATEKRSGCTIPINRSSWFDMFNRGVGYPTAKKFINWIKPSYAAFFSRCDALSRSMLNRGIRARSSAGHWLCFVGGMRASVAYQQQEFAAEYQPQFDFILQRCDADIAMFSKIRGLIDSGEVAKQDAVAIMRLMLPYWQKYSLVPKDELLAYQNALVLHASGKLIGEEAIAALLSSYCYLYLDFYLNLFASYEVGCALTYRNDQSDLTSKKGLLCRSLTRFLLNIDDESKTSTCFGELLEEVRDAISKNFGELSIRQMARHIPIKSDLSNPSAETDSDRCYNTLKAWRKGKDVPSREVLEKFFANLTEKIGPGHNEQLILMCNMAIGLDKMRKNWAQQLSTAKELKNTAPLVKVFSEVIGRYDTYYLHHLQLQLNKK